MQQYIRRYNYIQDYFYTAFEHYIKYYPAYPINYYSIDRNLSIWDDEFINGGSYEKLGVGKLSGVKFMKVYSLPVYSVSQVNINIESADKGLTHVHSLNFTFTVPDIYGLTITPGDIIDSNFGMMNISSANKPLFAVTKTDPAHYGEYLKLTQVSVSVAPFRIDQIEQQLSSIWKFYEPTKEILPYPNVDILYNILNKFKNVNDDVNNNFLDKNCGVYLTTNRS